MLAKDVTHKEVITVSKNENLDQLTAKFLRYNFHTLPVIDIDNKVLGIVSYEDLMKIFLPQDYALQELQKPTRLHNSPQNVFQENTLQKDQGSKVIVSDIMDTDIIAADENMTMIEVRTLMRHSGILQMPVVTKDGTLIGIVTLFDIIISLFKVMDIIK